MNWKSQDPKTTLGGIVILAAVAMMWLKVLTAAEALSVMGIAAGWIGIAAKDGNKP